MAVRLISFGRKHRQTPDGFQVVDASRLTNPHSEARLRPLDGRDVRVQAFLTLDQPRFREIVDRVIREVQKGKNVSVRCYGGRHRSVAVVELAAQELRDAGIEVQVEHWELS